MAKKPSAVYEPGELDRVRRNLGDLDPNEAKRIASLLGGEVGVEKAKAPPVRERPRSSRDETVTVSIGGKSAPPRRRVEILEGDEGRRRTPATASKASKKSAELDADDPTVEAKASYLERVRIDRYMALPEFEIKNSSQVLYSMISLFGEPQDLVNPDFVTRRMNEYYGRLEVLVTATRTMLPRNNIPRAETFRKKNPFGFQILDVIRQWNIERIASELAGMQSKPRQVTVAAFAEILKAFYRPLYVLEPLDAETHVRDAYRDLYKQLVQENGTEAKEKHNPQVKAALAAFVYIRRSVRFLLYPLLLKLLSDQWIAYDDFFAVRRRRVSYFLGLSEVDRLKPPAPGAEAAEAVGPAEEKPAESTERETEQAEPTPEEPKESAEEAPAPADRPGSQSRAFLRGLDTLDSMFPDAGWRHPEIWPDLYPYFAGVFDFKKGFELVAPTDPIHQVGILMHILEELFYGLRHIDFGTIPGADGEAQHAGPAIARIMDGWHAHLEESLGKEYLPRLVEYCRLIEGTTETRTSTYAKRTLTELLWFKRLCFLPYLSFDSSFSSHPFRNKEIAPLHADVRELRTILTGVAAGIEAGSKRGGAGAKAHCDGIDNPWDLYSFQIPNPVSIRIDALLGGKTSRKRTNAALVFFTLSVAAVLDGIVNTKDGYAYVDGSDCPFRSVDGDGVKPTFEVDQTLDADEIFKRAMRARTGS
jgi:hypothetical protein